MNRVRFNLPFVFLLSFSHSQARGDGSTPTFQPEERSPTETMGLALLLAVDGDTYGAVRLAKTSSEASNDDAGFLERLAALADEGLRRMQEKRSTLRVQGEEGLVHIISFDRNALVIKPRRKPERTVPRSAWGLQSLKGRLRIDHLSVTAADLGSIHLLLGKSVKTAIQLSKAAGSDMSVIRQRNERWQEILNAGRVRRRLEELLHVALPSDHEAEVDGWLSIMTDLRVSYRDSETVRKNIETLDRLGTALLVEKHKWVPWLEIFLHGFVERLPSERVRIHYIFCDKDEALDFSSGESQDKSDIMSGQLNLLSTTVSHAARFTGSTRIQGDFAITSANDPTRQWRANARKSFTVRLDDKRASQGNITSDKEGRFVFSAGPGTRLTLWNIRIEGTLHPEFVADVRLDWLNERLEAWRGGTTKQVHALLNPEAPVTKMEKAAATSHLLTLRREGFRKEKTGRGPKTKESVELGLDWLARAQSPNGGWDADGYETNLKGSCPGKGHPLYDYGTTGLALMAFLGKGSTHLEGGNQETVKRALGFLVGGQNKNGRLGDSRAHNYTYSHAIASLALCEAYEMTRDPKLYWPARRSIEFIEQLRNPYAAWRYGIRAGDNDTSVTAWMVQALATARIAGIPVDPACFKGAMYFIDTVTTKYGTVGYTLHGSGSVRLEHVLEVFPPRYTQALTGAGIASRIFMGQDPLEDGRIRKGADLLAQLLPAWDKPKIDMYYWYYGTLAMSQVGGNDWKKWSRALNRALVDHQEQDGVARGSWAPIGAWGGEGGRVYSTAILILALEASYRYPSLLHELARKVIADNEAPVSVK